MNKRSMNRLSVLSLLLLLPTSVACSVQIPSGFSIGTTPSGQSGDAGATEAGDAAPPPPPVAEGDDVSLLLSAYPTWSDPPPNNRVAVGTPTKSEPANVGDMAYTCT